MNKPRIYADFQNLDDSNRIRLTCVGTIADLDRNGVTLHSGLELTLYTDDADDQGNPDELLIDGLVDYSESEKCWVAEVDWSALRHASDEKAGNGVGLHSGPMSRTN